MEGLALDRRVRPEWLEIDIWAAADGWPLRRFRVAADPEVAPRGSLLFQTGRADFIEKYIESFDHWRQHGWAIEGFDWRGQGGSGRVVVDGRTGHGPPYEVMIGDLAAYWEDWLGRTAGPHVLLGHSMGGHLALRLLVERSLAIDGAVLISPMLGLNAGLIGERVGRLVANLLCWIGWTERPAWSEDSNEGSGHRQRNLTHSDERYEDELWWREHDPMLDVGPPSWGWLRNSWGSIAELFRPEVLERIDAPMLLLCADQDRLVLASAIKLAARRLPKARLVCHPQSAHEILREIDPIRKWALAEIDGFMDPIGKRA
jgi:lysophospholipase